MRIPAFLAIALLSAIAAHAQTRINSLPFTINAPGSYQLVRNITAGNAKLTIQASNVTLDLGGFTITASTPNEVLTILAFNTPVSNVVIENGSIINTVGGIVYMGASEVTFDHLSMISSGQNAFTDEGGRNNRITHCSLISGSPASPQGPTGCHGDSRATIQLSGSSDTVEDCIITSTQSIAVISWSPGCLPSTAGNVFVRNVIHSPYQNSLSLNFCDVYSGNAFPGQPAGATNVNGGVPF
jgi:hypothetical protein